MRYAKSWWYESAYGCSLLRPLLRIQELINQFENDMGIIVHTHTKPMLVVKAGTPQNPFTDAQLKELKDVLQNRKQGTDVFIRRDVETQVIESMSRGINVDFWLDYLYKRREALLGVPKIFLGESEGTNRAPSDTVMQEFVTRLRMMQEIIGDILETVLFKPAYRPRMG